MPSVIKVIPYDEAYESGFEDMPRRVPDLSKIAAMIGYRPEHTLDEIIRETASGSGKTLVDELTGAIDLCAVLKHHGHL